jgi:hypothetical protein
MNLSREVEVSINTAVQPCEDQKVGGMAILAFDVVVNNHV